MLRFLSIQRLAIIDALAVEFAPGFNVVTGETGAGKSIVVGAIDLLLGGRASSDMVRTGADGALVQALLQVDESKEVIVRREMSAAGRSRAFVDESLVTAAALRSVTCPLIDLHGQHDHQQLLDPVEHLLLLDTLAGAEREVQDVAAAWDALAAAREAVEALSMGQREREARLEMARFQLGEIEKVNPAPGEDDGLANERRVLQNAERLHRLAAEAYADLYDADEAALARLRSVWRRVDELASLDTSFEPYRQTREAVQPLLDDLAAELRGYASRVETSPERLQAVEDRLAALERLKRKYGPALEDVLRKAAEFRTTIENLDASAERGEEVRAALDAAERRYREAADRLSARRRMAAASLPGRLEAELAELAMERTRCAFPLESDAGDPSRWSARGWDRGELFISANAGEAPRPLARIASGGELSRVMLALKSIASTDAVGKTLIFDEVDVGISGRVADTVGRRLRDLGRRFQVICITHLPQVAAYATSHFHVAKRVEGGRTIATMTLLSEVDRIEEIARLLAGREVSASARATARDMLAGALGGESESKRKAKGESEGRSRAKVPRA